MLKSSLHPLPEAKHQMSLSIADSKAVLQRRVQEVALGDKLDTLKKLGFETHSDLGFAFNFTPGCSEAATMRVSGELRHVKWEEFTKRDSEIGNQETDSFVKTDLQAV